MAILGARIQYAILRILNDIGALDRYYADIDLGSKPWLERLFKGKIATCRSRWDEVLVGQI